MIKSNLGRAALEYAANGYKVFPLVPHGKTPATKNGFYAATTDQQQIETWWTSNPDYNIGLLTGEGVVVIDLDVNHGKSSNDGIAFLRDYQEQHGAFPETAICATPRGGQHFYYAVEKEYASKVNLYPGVDVCGTNHYIVLPPSVTENGAYQWVTHPITEGIAEADNKVIEFISKEPDRRKGSSGKYSRGIVHEGGRHNFLISQLGKICLQGLSEEKIRAKIHLINQQRCDPPMTEQELEDEIFEAIPSFLANNADWNDKRPDKWRIVDLLRGLDAYQNNKYRALNDISFSRLFADCFKDYILFNTTSNNWMYYNGVKWVDDAYQMRVEWIAKEFVDALHILCTEIEDEERKEEVGRKIKRFDNRRFRLMMIDDAKSEYAVEASDFDTAENLFNCRNCVIDLSSGTIIDHSPDLLLSKVANVTYDPAAASPDFDRFIQDIMMGDNQKIRYLQTLFGYAMYGNSWRDEAYMLYGSSTRNGKSTLLDTIRYLFGDYAKSAQPETIAMRFKNSSSPSEDIARLAGCRLLQMSEPPKDMPLDVAQLKLWTGGEVQTARYMYKSLFQFKPVFKLFINTNYLPVVTDETLFSSNRIKVITFDRYLRPEEQDPTLRDRLKSDENLSGILNWIIKGANRVRLDKDAFSIPASVAEATEAYRLNADKTQCFINEKLEEDSEAVEKASTLYAEYEVWCKDHGYHTDHKAAFFQALRNKGMLQDHGTVNGKTVRNIVKGYKLISIESMPF